MFRKAVAPAGALASEKPAGLLRSVADALTLRLHRLAVSTDNVPSEFGDAEPVDETDPAALRREWRRQYRIWADSSPEQLFAIKVGGLILGGAILAMLVVVQAF